MSSITNSPVASLPYKGADYRAQSILNVMTDGDLSAGPSSDIFSVRGKDRITVLVDLTHNAATDVVLTLDQSDDGTTFYDEQMSDDSAPPLHTLGNASYSKAVSGDVTYYFDIPVNCRFARLTATGTAADTDTLSLKVVIAVDGGIGR